LHTYPNSEFRPSFRRKPERNDRRGIVAERCQSSRHAPASSRRKPASSRRKPGSSRRSCGGATFWMTGLRCERQAPSSGLADWKAPSPADAASVFQPLEPGSAQNGTQLRDGLPGATPGAIMSFFDCFRHGFDCHTRAGQWIAAPRPGKPRLPGAAPRPIGGWTCPAGWSRVRPRGYPHGIGPY
jgi:hypothetical protein